MNDEYKLFIESDELITRINALSDIIFEQTHHHVVFEEFIAIPFYGGNIILRFNLNTKNYTLDDLDHYEAIMNRIVGNEFLVDFMGDVYRSSGVDFTNIEAKYRAFSVKYQYIAIPESVYSTRVHEDAQYLLGLCGLPENTPVWEIQVEHPMPLLILGNSHRLLKKIDDIEVIETAREPCEGLIKAAIYAKEQGISLGRMIKDY